MNNCTLEIYAFNLEAEFPAAIHIETVEEAGPLIQVVQPLRVQQLTPRTEIEIVKESQKAYGREAHFMSYFVVGTYIQWFVLAGLFCSTQECLIF